MRKAMYIGPRGGKWADPQHKIPWKPEKSKRTTDDPDDYDHDPQAEVRRKPVTLIKRGMSIEQAEQAIQGEEIEHLLIVGADGHHIHRGRGTSNQVVCEAAVFGRMRKQEGARMTHNHPSGNPLSVQDIWVATFSGAAEMRAVGPTGRVYSIKRDAKHLLGFDHDRELDKQVLNAFGEDLARIEYREVREAHVEMERRMVAKGWVPGTDPHTGDKSYFDQEVWNAIVQEKLRAALTPYIKHAGWEYTVIEPTKAADRRARPQARDRARPRHRDAGVPAAAVQEGLGLREDDDAAWEKQQAEKKAARLAKQETPAAKRRQQVKDAVLRARKAADAHKEWKNNLPASVTSFPSYLQKELEAAFPKTFTKQHVRAAADPERFSDLWAAADYLSEHLDRVSPLKKSDADNPTDLMAERHPAVNPGVSRRLSHHASTHPMSGKLEEIGECSKCESPMIGKCGCEARTPANTPAKKRKLPMIGHADENFDRLPDELRALISQQVLEVQATELGGAGQTDPRPSLHEMNYRVPSRELGTCSQCAHGRRTGDRMLDCDATKGAPPVAWSGRCDLWVANATLLRSRAFEDGQVLVKSAGGARSSKPYGTHQLPDYQGIFHVLPDAKDQKAQALAAQERRRAANAVGKHAFHGTPPEPTLRGDDVTPPKVPPRRPENLSKPTHLPPLVFKQRAKELEQTRDRLMGFIKKDALPVDEDKALRRLERMYQRKPGRELLAHINKARKARGMPAYRAVDAQA